MNKKTVDEFTSEEAARRRDEVIRRMANTPPQHTKSLRPQGKRKTTGAKGAAKKGRATSG